MQPEGNNNMYKHVAQDIRQQKQSHNRGITHA